MTLFARIWLSYWLIMATTLVSTLVVSLLLAFARAENLDRLSPAALASAAQDAAQRNEPGLRDWILKELHSNPELQIYFVDATGRELSNRTIVGGPLSAKADSFSVTTATDHRYSMRIHRVSGFVFDAWNILLRPYALIGLAILASGGGAALLARYFTRPVSRLREGVRAIAVGNLEARMPDNLRARTDELGALARDFDGMAESLRELIASKEQLLRDVSHELRSPLARLRVAISLVGRGPDRDDQWQRMEHEIERLDATLSQLLRFSRVQSPPNEHFEEFPLAVLVEECVADAAMEAAMGRKTVQLTLSQELCVLGNRNMLRSAFENVLRNAVRFAPEDSVIAVRVVPNGNSAIVSVADSGRGVAESDLPRIFEPFFRAHGGDGAGLGLSIASRIMDIHGGSITACNCASGGLEMILTVPAKSAGRCLGDSPSAAIA